MIFDTVSECKKIFRKNLGDEKETLQTKKSIVSNFKKIIYNFFVFKRHMTHPFQLTFIQLNK